MAELRGEISMRRASPAAALPSMRARNAGSNERSSGVTTGICQEVSDKEVIRAPFSLT